VASARAYGAGVTTFPGDGYAPVPPVRVTVGAAVAPVARVAERRQATVEEPFPHGGPDRDTVAAQV